MAPRIPTIKIGSRYDPDMNTRSGALVSVLVAAVLALVILTVPAASRTPRHEGNSIVVLLHGLGRSKYAMWLLEQRLQNAGFQVENIGYSSLRASPDQIVNSVSQKIARCCIGKSRELHFVGHSLGGLIIRAYLANNAVPNLGRVVLIGTPNKGSEIVDRYKDQWWLKLLGPTVQALGTTRGSLASSLPQPNYPLGVIAGRSGVLRNEHLLPGPDDGLVSLESTKVRGMQDFVVVDSGHSMMRYNKDVADQTISFLSTGQFAKRPH